MTNKSTKRALVSSLLVLVLCFTMLLGTTFAWFTDSASSNGNKITTGNLDVDLYLWTGTDAVTEITSSAAPIFDETTIWEPGMTKVVYLSIVNNGSLALKYKVGLEVKNVTKKLNEVMSYDIIPDATFGTVTAWSGNGTNVDLGTNATEANNVELAPGAEHYFALAVHMDENAGNEYMNGTIEFDINVLAGQLTAEEDSFGKDYDKDAVYPNVSTSYVIPTTGATEDADFETADVKVSLPASIINNLPQGVEAVQLAHTDVKADADAKTITFDAVEFVDQNGNIIDLTNNTEDFTITLPVGNVFAAGATVEIYHDGNLVTTAIVSENKTVTYTVKHFCEVTLNLPTAVVTTYEELKAALADANIAKVVMANNITAKADQSNGYGATGIKVDGKILDGNGYTLKITGAGGTWDSAINIASGTVQNITVAGAMRGIFTGGTNGDIYMNNVTFSGVVYTFNSDAGSKNYGVYANNCNFNGWTSFSDCHKEVVFTDCSFAKGGGYAFARPYQATTFVNCTFAAGYKFDTSEVASGLTFTNCNYAGTLMTAENATTLATDNVVLFFNGLNGVTFN